MHPFSTRWKQNLPVFRCFQGVEKGCIGNKWVNGTMNLRYADETSETYLDDICKLCNLSDTEKSNLFQESK